METAQFETSVGPVTMEVEAGNWLAVHTVGVYVPLGQKDQAHLGTWPYAYVPLVRRRGRWAPPGTVSGGSRRSGLLPA